VSEEKDNKEIPIEKPPPPAETFLFSRWLFTRCFGAIHFVAFFSFAVEILGLNGSHGIEPTTLLLERVREYCGGTAMFVLPTLAWFNSSDSFIIGMAIAGVVLSVFVIAGILAAPSLVLLAILWLSLINGGGEFTAFQSDGLLVETTVLSLFFVRWCVFDTPWKSAKPTSIEPSLLSILLLRFLLFRLMFSGGLVKLLSGDPTWQDLTAMSYHYETQPIPTPLAWFVYHLPLLVHKVSVIQVFLTELVVPLTYFFPGRGRLIAAIYTALLHFGIILTGNYTFLNYLCIVLCFPLVDDSYWLKIMPGKWRAKVVSDFVKEPLSAESLIESAKASSRVRLLVRHLANVFAAVFLLFGTCRFSAGVLRGFVVPAIVREALTFTAPFHLFNSYGMFAVMTTTRPEIVFEGSDDCKRWKVYEFHYKVGDLYKPPPIVAPHMARLDWRLWFAAMDGVSENPWVFEIVKLLLTGDPQIKPFFRDYPFPDHPPRYIRAFVYDYHFSDWNQLFTRGQWWTRDNQRTYFPPVMLGRDGEVIPAM
jgi:Protein of unknown function (DUF1222).